MFPTWKAVNRMEINIPANLIIVTAVTAHGIGYQSDKRKQITLVP